MASLLPGRADADDVFQQVSLVLWRKFAEFRAGSDFAAWGRQVARFEVLMYLRARARDRLVLTAEAIDAVAAEADAMADRLEEERRALDRAWTGSRRPTATSSSAATPAWCRSRRSRGGPAAPRTACTSGSVGSARDCSGA